MNIFLHYRFAVNTDKGIVFGNNINFRAFTEFIKFIRYTGINKLSCLISSYQIQKFQSTTLAETVIISSIPSDNEASDKALNPPP